MTTPVLSSIKLIPLIVSVICAFHSASAQSNGGIATVAIMEIMYNPPESGADSLEYIEIFNYGSSAVDMSGFTFTGIDMVIPPGAPAFEPGDRGVLTINSNAVVGTFGLPFAFEWTSGALSNDGEGLSIRDAQGNLVDTVYFDDTVAWPALADGGGASLERCDPTSDGTLPSSWIASTTSMGVTVNEVLVYGTPQAENSECVAVGIDDPIITTLSAFPNPSSNGVFSLNTMVNGGVYDLVGQLVQHLNGVRSIDLSANVAGHYILRTDDGQVIRLMK